MLVIGVLCPAAAGAEPLNSDEGRLLRGDVLISFKEAPDTSVHEVKGEVLIDAPWEMVWPVLTDYASYYKIFPSIAASEVLERKNGAARLKIRINNLWPYSDFVYTLKVKEDKNARTISLVMEEGNLKTEYESFAIQPFAPDPAKSKVVYVLARDPGWFVPRFSADLDNRAIVIERLLAVRKEVRNRKKSLEPATENPEIKPQWRKALFWWEKNEDSGSGQDNSSPQNAPQPSPQPKEEKPAPLPAPPPSSNNNSTPPKNK